MKYLHLILLMCMILSVIVGLYNSCIIEGVTGSNICSTDNFELNSQYNNKNQNIPVKTANILYMSKLPTQGASERIGIITFKNDIKNVTSVSSTSPLFSVERNTNNNLVWNIMRTDHSGSREHDGRNVRDLILDVIYSSGNKCKVEIKVELIDVESDCKRGCGEDVNNPLLIYKSDTLGVNNDGKLEYKHFYRTGCKYVENPDLLMDKSVEERSKFCNSHNDCYTCGTYETTGILTKDQLIQQYSENKEKRSEFNKMDTCVKNNMDGGMNSMNAMRTCLNMENEIKEIQGSSISGGLSGVVGMDSSDIDAKGYENKGNSNLGNVKIEETRNDIENKIMVEQKETNDRYNKLMEKHIKEMHGMELDNVDVGVKGYERAVRM